MILPFGPFAPDRPPTAEFVVGGKNVYAKPDGTYCPWPDFVATYTALSARCQGAFYSIDSSATTALWAGTASKLFKNVSGVAFSDVSKAGGYTLASDESWEFEQYGQRVIATNIADAVQSYVIGTSALFADLAAGAPKARHIAAVANFIMLGGTSDGVYGAQPDGLWWSGIGDPTSWPTAGTAAAAAAQSGRINISGQGGFIQRIVPRVGTLDAVVLQEKQISRCIYVGTPDVFAFQPMEGARGTPSPDSVAKFGGKIYYLGEDGFYSNDGTQSEPIGAGWVDDFFYDDVNQTKISRVVGVIDPRYKVYVIGYPSNSSSDGTIDRLLTYNYESKRWAPPIETSIEYLTRLGSVGYTLEGLDVFGTMDSIMTSLDSRVWMGDGKPILAGFNTSHSAGFFSGPLLEAILETGDLDLQGAMFFSKGIRPIVTGTDAVLTCAIGIRNTMNAAVTYGNYAALNRELFVPVRSNTRHIRALLKVAAGATATHLQGVDVLGMPVSNLGA